MPRPEEVVPPLVRRHLRVSLAGAEEVAALAGVRGGGGRIGFPSPVQKIKSLSHIFDFNFLSAN